MMISVRGLTGHGREVVSEMSPPARKSGRVSGLIGIRISPVQSSVRPRRRGQTRLVLLEVHEVLDLLGLRVRTAPAAPRTPATGAGTPGTPGPIGRARQFAKVQNFEAVKNSRKTLKKKSGAIRRPTSRDNYFRPRWVLSIKPHDLKSKVEWIIFWEKTVCLWWH